MLYSQSTPILTGMDNDNKFDELEEKLLGQSPKEAGPVPLEFLEFITNKFSADNEVGRGAFGVVYKGVLPKSGKFIAVKKIFDIHLINNDGQFEKEITNLLGLDHQHIVRLRGYCMESRTVAVMQDGNHIMAEKLSALVCLDFLGKGNLHEHVQGCPGLKWNTRYEIIKGICNGLDFLHTIGLLHLDLKSQNIMLNDNMEPKIVDFGLSRLLGESKSRTITKNLKGTIGYMAPEYIDHGIITRKADIFSFGVIIIEIITIGDNKRYTYYSDDDESSQHMERFTNEVIGKWRERFQTMSNTPLEKYIHQIKQCINIALRCLDRDYQKRPETRKIIEDMMNSENLLSMLEEKTDGKPVAEVQSICSFDEPPNLPSEVPQASSEMAPSTRHSENYHEKLDNKTHGESVAEINSTGSAFPLGSVRDPSNLPQAGGNNEDTKDDGVHIYLTLKRIVHWVTSKIATALVRGFNGYGTINQVSGSQLLSIEPLQLRFLSERNKSTISCSLNLTNRTDNYVVFSLRSTRTEQCFSRPPCGVIPPRSEYSLVAVVPETEKPPANDDSLFMFESTITRAQEVNDNLNKKPDDIDRWYKNLFAKARKKSNNVHQVNLAAVHVYTPYGNMIVPAESFAGVLSVDVHPMETWIIASNQHGFILIWNYQTQERVVDLFEVTSQTAVKAVKFIAPKKWFIAGCDNGVLEVYDYNTTQKIKTIKAHHQPGSRDNNVMSLDVHPNKPYVLSAGIDGKYKLWDWEKNWTCIRSFEMLQNEAYQVKFNPWENKWDDFASACMHSAEIWNIRSVTPYKLDADGMVDTVACLEYFVRDNRQYIITFPLDNKARIWDYQSKTWSQTFMAAHQVGTACCHPDLPMLITGSYDGTVCLWNTTTFRTARTIELPQRILNFGLGAVSAIVCLKDSRILVGHEGGFGIIKVYLASQST